MRCPYCSNVLPEGTTFCDRCGQVVPVESAQSSASTSYWSEVEKQTERDEKIRVDAENKILDKQKRRHRTIIISIVLAVAFAVSIGAITFYKVSVYPQQQYTTAIELLNNGNFQEALTILESLGNYRDAGAQVTKCQEGINELRYQDGIAQYQAGNYHAALIIFEELGLYKESNSFAAECRLQIWEIEDNNTYQTATCISPNTEYFGNLESEWETEQDWYAFELEVPACVHLIFNSQKQISDDAYWDVSIRSGSNPDEDLWQEYIYGDATMTESITLSLSAGTYYVEIESSNSHSTDNYSLEVVCQDNEGNWEIETNNSYEEANSIFLDLEYFGVLQSEWETEQDWYVFTLDSPTVVSLIFNTEEQDSDSTYWDISIRSHENPGEDIWQDYIGGYTTKTESDSLELSVGTYYVEIESSNNHSTDAYSFKVTSIS